MSTAPGSSPAPRKGIQPAIRLFTAETQENHDGNDHRAELTPDLTLRQFFDLWMLPVLLEAQNDASAATKLLYRDALGWWETVTGDPPLSQIDEWTWSQFVSGLREARYKRGTFAQVRSLSATTQAKHQKAIRAILSRAEKRKLVAPFDCVVRKVETDVKASFSLAQARQIAAWLRMGPTKLQQQHQVGLGASHSWWLAFVACGFYTGLRSGELLALTWSMLQTKDDGPWLLVPAEAVQKTGKPYLKALHVCLAEALEGIGPRQPHEPILPWFRDYRQLVLMHEKLQVMAGIPPEQILSPHAWRRTFGTQIALTGLRQAQEAAQQGLAHSSVETTKGHYLQAIVEGTAIRMLPRLW
jgi:integrase